MANHQMDVPTIRWANHQMGQPSEIRWPTIRWANHKMVQPSDGWANHQMGQQSDRPTIWWTNHQVNQPSDGPTIRWATIRWTNHQMGQPSDGPTIRWVNYIHHGPPSGPTIQRANHQMNQPSDGPAYKLQKCVPNQKNQLWNKCVYSDVYCPKPTQTLFWDFSRWGWQLLHGSNFQSPGNLYPKDKYITVS